MIIGVGVDIVQIARIADTPTPARLAARVLHPTELMEWQNANEPARVLAKRWAVKEAFSKACATGMREPLAWHELWLTHSELGAPSIEVSPNVKAWLSQRGISCWHVSISDERDYVVAFAVVES